MARVQSGEAGVQALVGRMADELGIVLQQVNGHGTLDDILSRRWIGRRNYARNGGSPSDSYGAWGNLLRAQTAGNITTSKYMRTGLEVPIVCAVNVGVSLSPSSSIGIGSSVAMRLTKLL